MEPLVWWNHVAYNNFSSSPDVLGWAIAIVFGLIAGFIIAVVEEILLWTVGLILGILTVGWFLSSSAFWWDFDKNQAGTYWVYALIALGIGVLFGLVLHHHGHQGIKESKGFKYIVVLLVLGLIVYLAFPPLSWELNYPTDYQSAWISNNLWWLILLVVGGVIFLFKMG